LLQLNYYLIYFKYILLSRSIHKYHDRDISEDLSNIDLRNN
jgi:hypothetical protein